MSYFRYDGCTPDPYFYVSVESQSHRACLLNYFGPQNAPLDRPRFRFLVAYCKVYCLTTKLILSSEHKSLIDSHI